MTKLFKQSGRPLRPLACLAAIGAGLMRQQGGEAQCDADSSR